MSHSENRARNTQTSSQQVTNLNLQDTEGVAVAGYGNAVNVTTTDFGAVDAARDFANAALDVGVEALHIGSSNLVTAADLAGRGLDNALDATRGALDFGESVSGRALDFGESFGGRAIDFAQDIFKSALGAQANLAKDNLSGLTQLARTTSESADDRVSRTAMYAFAAIAAVFVLPALFGRAR